MNQKYYFAEHIRNEAVYIQCWGIRKQDPKVQCFGILNT